MLSSHPATPNTFSALAKTAVSGLTQAATKPSTQSFCILQTGTPPVLFSPSLSTAKSSLQRIKPPAQHMCELKQAPCYCSASEECPQCSRRKIHFPAPAQQPLPKRRQSLHKAQTAPNSPNGQHITQKKDRA